MLPRLLLALATLAVLAAPTRAQDPIAACTDGVAVLPDVGAFACESVDLMGYLSVSAFATDGSPAALGSRTRQPSPEYGPDIDVDNTQPLPPPGSSPPHVCLVFDYAISKGEPGYVRPS